MKDQHHNLTHPVKDTGAFADLKAAHVAIRTTDYSGMIKWYCGQLGFRLVHEWTAGALQLAFLALPGNDDFIIEILGSTAAIPQDSTVKTGYDHICFRVHNLKQTMQALTARGITITRSFAVPAIGKQVAFICDPFGNTIEFFADMQ